MILRDCRRPCGARVGVVKSWHNRSEHETKKHELDVAALRRTGMRRTPPAINRSLASELATGTRAPRDQCITVYSPARTETSELRESGRARGFFAHNSASHGRIGQAQNAHTTALGSTGARVAHSRPKRGQRHVHSVGITCARAARRWQVATVKCSTLPAGARSSAVPCPSGVGEAAADGEGHSVELQVEEKRGSVG